MDDGSNAGRWPIRYLYADDAGPPNVFVLRYRVKDKVARVLIAKQYHHQLHQRPAHSKHAKPHMAEAREERKIHKLADLTFPMDLC